jgi:predicted RNase H-like HicB family nuclease
MSNILEERLDGIEARIERLEKLYGIDHKSPTPTCTASIEDNRCLVSVPGCQVYITSFAHGNTYEEAARMGTEAIEVALMDDTTEQIGE